MITSQRDKLKQKETKEKKDYEPPEIVYREALEVIAGACDSWKATFPPCSPTDS